MWMGGALILACIAGGLLTTAWARFVQPRIDQWIEGFPDYSAHSDFDGAHE